MTTWSSDSSIWCSISAGEGGPFYGNQVAAITLGNRITSAVRLLSYNMPVISSARHSNSIPRMDIRRSMISLFGANLGIFDGTLLARYLKFLMDLFELR